MNGNAQKGTPVGKEKNERSSYTNLSNIRTYPNQKIVVVHPSPSHEARDSAHPYGILTRRENFVAANLLGTNGAAYVIYIDITLNQTGFGFALSPIYYSENYMLSKRQYAHAINILKEKGFLVQSNKYKRILEFHRIPEKYESGDIRSLLNLTSGSSSELQSYWDSIIDSTDSKTTCQMSANDAQEPETVPDDAQEPETVPDDTQEPETVPNDAQEPETVRQPSHVNTATEKVKHPLFDFSVESDTCHFGETYSTPKKYYSSIKKPSSHWDDDDLEFDIGLDCPF